MAVKVSDLNLAWLVLFMLWNMASAQTGCTTALISLSPCLNYVGGNSTTPSSSCCSQLATVVQGQPRCLCSLLKGQGPSLGFTINQTLALALPGACNVQTPPVSQCDAANGPATSVPAPAESPASDSPDAGLPEAPNSDFPSDSGTGSKTGPGSDGATVGGSSRGVPSSSVGIFLLVALSTLCATSSGYGF